MDIFDQIKALEQKSKLYEINEEVYQHFLLGFDDRNTLHIDDEYAQQKGFKGKVMHGSIINGLLSNFIGMVYPANNVIIHSVTLDFKKPSYLNDKIEITATTDQVIESVRAAILKVSVKNLSQDYICAKGKVQVGFLK